VLGVNADARAGRGFPLDHPILLSRDRTR